MGTQQLPNDSYKMKILFALFSLLTLASAQEPEGCEFCRAGVGIMFGHMSSDALEKTIKLLDELVCPNAPLDMIEGCKTGVKTWWPIISQIIFNDEAAKYVCAGLSEGACNAFQYGSGDAWSCEVCAADVSLVALAYSPQYGVPGMVEALQGDAFCKNPALELDESQQAICIEVIGQFMYPAMDVITSHWRELSRAICRDWFDGICP